MANEITTKGGTLEKAIDDYKVTELRKMVSDLSPKKQRKSKKTIAAETDHEALLATLANSLKNVSNSEAVVETKEEVVETKEEVVETKEEVVEDDSLDSELDSSDDDSSDDDSSDDDSSDDEN